MRGFRSIARPPLRRRTRQIASDDIEIELENALLVERRFEHQSDERLLGLAQPTPFGCEKQLFREPLTDRRAACNGAAALPVLFQRHLDAVPVESLVFDELRVLGRHDRSLQVVLRDSIL
jgi:hypothetical protein